MTFNGASTKNAGVQEQTTVDSDPFAPPKPLLPSFLEEGKDMIRRITSDTVLTLLIDLSSFTVCLWESFNLRLLIFI